MNSMRSLKHGAKQRVLRWVGEWLSQKATDSMCWTGFIFEPTIPVDIIMQEMDESHS